MKRGLLASISFVAACLATVAVPTIALADASVQINPTATLEAKGAYVVAEIQVVCPLGSTMDPFGQGGPTMAIEQAVSKSAIASGQGTAHSNTMCTGSAQTLSIPVLANTSGPPFRKGPAAATVFGQACDASFSCVLFSSGPVTIQIVR